MDLSDKMSSTRRRSSRLQNVDDDDTDNKHDNESIALSLSRQRSSTSGRSRRQRTTSTTTTGSSSITKENNQATQQKDDDDDDDDSISKRPRRSTRNRSDSSNNRLQLPQSSSLNRKTKEKRKMTAATTTTTTTTMESATKANKKPRTTKTTTSTLSISTTKRSSSKSSSTRKQTKSVTPSPIATSTTTGTAFGFDSPNEKDDQRSLPSGVVDLYNDDSTTTTTTTTNISVEPSNQQLRRRRSTKPKQSRSSSSLSLLSSRCEYNGRSIAYSDSSTTESLTVHFIQTYGEEYWNILHESERAIINDPSKTSDNSSSNLSSPKRRNRRGIGIPFGSPQSTSTSSSSSSVSSSTTAMSKVTPNERQNDFVVNEDWNKKKNIRNLHQQPCESTTLMSVQPNLTPKMRSILIDWLIELSEHFSFESSTLHLAVTMVDRVLASGRSLHGGGDDEQRRRRRPRSSSQTFSLSSTSASMLTKDSHNNSYDSGLDTDEEDDNEDDNDNYDDDEEGSKDTRCYLIPRDRFQLLGATCVWLACKVKEIAPPKAKEIAYVSDHIYTVEQIKTMERRVCNALNFTFFEAPTPHHFLFEFMRASFAQESAASTSTGTTTCTNSTTGGCSCGCRRCIIPAAATGVGLAIDSVFRDMAHYLLELGRLPYGPTGRKPSLLAAAVVYLTRVTLGIPRATIAHRSLSSSSECNAYWTPTLEYYTGYAKSDLFETVLELHAYHMAAETTNLKAVFSKYKTKRFHRVALKTVVLREDLGF
jgi:hypothetical protein